MSDKLLTTEQLAESLGLPVRTVSDLARRKKIPSVRLGYRTRRFQLPRVLKALRKWTEGDSED